MQQLLQLRTTLNIKLLEFLYRFKRKMRVLRRGEMIFRRKCAFKITGAERQSENFTRALTLYVYG